MKELMIAAGSYSGVLYGMALRQEKDAGARLVPSFSSNVHSGCIKHVAMRGSTLVSGSTDESVQVFNLKKRTETGTLMHHTGAVLCMRFAGSSMYSCGEDGAITMWRVSDWEPLLTLKGHKRPVFDLSVHPLSPGSALLSVGRDRTVRLWNLKTGKTQFKSKLRYMPQLVRWSPKATKYIVVSGRDIHVHDVEIGKFEKTLSCSSDVNAVCFVSDTLLACGCENGDVVFLDISTGEPRGQLSTGDRIRGLCEVVWRGRRIVTSASSGGTICVWDITSLYNGESIPEAAAGEGADPTDLQRYLVAREVIHGARLTCLATLVMRVASPKGPGDASSSSASNSALVASRLHKAMEKGPAEELLQQIQEMEQEGVVEESTGGDGGDPSQSQHKRPARRPRKRDRGGHGAVAQQGGRKHEPPGAHAQPVKSILKKRAPAAEESQSAGRPQKKRANKGKAQPQAQATTAKKKKKVKGKR